MSAILRTLLVLATVGAVSLPSLLPIEAQGRRRAATQPSSPATPSEIAKQWVFESNQLEFYLNSDGIAYIRPGVKIKVVSITIPADRRPVVELTFTDDFDQPIDRLGKITPGAISASMVLARWNPETREYFSYTTRIQTTPASSPAGPGVTAIQAAADSGGTWTDLEMGRAQYRFRTVLPADFDTAATMTLGIYSARNLNDILGKSYYANVLHDFRADAQPITSTWDKISTASCNNCHDALAFHGGSRREMKLCVLCHTTQTVDPDTGETQDMETLTHKIHRGANLPSVLGGKPYIIIGNQQSVHDYSHVIYPQDIRNCDNCHEGITAAQKTSQSHVWFTNPTKEACYACHDNINMETGEGHPGRARADNSRCANCHVPDSGEEFDRSIKGAHTIPEKSKQLEGLKVAVVSFTNFKAGEKPTVTFALTNNAGAAVDGSKLATFAPMIAGPTSSYSKYFREAAPARAIFNATTGHTTFTFNNAIPADAKGTWTISGDFYRNVTIKRADGEADISLREAAYNPIRYAALDGGTATPRRTVAPMAQCNTCHDRLALHGGQRLVMEQCVICHNPLETDVARRPASAGAPESVSMQYMIHKIHRGHALDRDYTVYGFGGTPHNYNHVGYPGDLKNCAKCHTANSHRLPAKGDAVVTPRDFYSPMGSGTAACVSCHDNRDTVAHAFLNTAQFGGQPAESCGTCHGANATWSVDKVHAR
ncbi:MAG TPA: OmcA/MtrC family decaheme c-type cytochrome [Thermoanaerobaculia bacterium]